MIVTTGMILTELIEEKCISKHKLAIDLCMDPKTIRNYCDDKSIPDLNRAKSIADYFDVNVEYLIQYDTEDCQITHGYDIESLINDLIYYKNVGLTTALVESGKIVVMGNDGQEPIRKLKVM